MKKEILKKIPRLSTSLKKTGKDQLKHKRFNKRELTVFALAFVLVGGIVIWHSFAATPTINCVRLQGSICFDSSPDAYTCNLNSTTGLQNYTNQAKPIFLLNADTTSASYDYFIDGIKQGTVSTTPGQDPKICITPPNNIADGQHNFTANELAPDSSKHTLPDPYAFTVDTIPPPIPSKPAAIDYFDPIPGDNVVSSKPAVFLGVSSAPEARFVNIVFDATQSSCSPPDSTGTWHCTVGNISDGTHQFSAYSYDNAGNKSASSASVSLLVDGTLPSANIVVPATASNSVTLQVKDSNGNTATDNLSGMFKVVYKYRASGSSSDTIIGTATASPYSLNWSPNVASGTYTITADAYDKAGNITTTSSSMTISPVGPTVSITAPDPGTMIKGTIPYSASASVGSGGTAITKVEFYVDGAVKSTDTSSPYSFNWNSTTATNAQHALTAKAYDNASHVTTSDVINVTVDNSPPTQPGSFSARPAPFTQVYFTWVPSTDNIGIDHYEVWADKGTSEEHNNNYRPPDDCTNTLCKGFFDFNEPGVAHSFVVQAIDLAGNITSSPTVNVTTKDDINVAYLDDGTCGRDVRKNGDANTTNVINPSFYVTGDGNSASYNLEITHLTPNGDEIIYSGGSSTSLGNGKYCLSMPANINLTDGEQYSMFANEVSPTSDFGSTGVVFTISVSASIPGDANGDGHVNIIDLSILLSHYGSSFAGADFNHDGIVNIIDLSILLSHYGS